MAQQHATHLHLAADGQGEGERGRWQEQMKPDRKTFLMAFLGSFGKKIIVNEITTGHVSGTVIYNSPEEVQDFCWHVTENDVPSEAVYRLACLIQEDDLLNIDRIIPSVTILRGRYNQRWGTNLEDQSFIHVLRELEDVTVDMVTDGVSNDAFFIHE